MEFSDYLNFTNLAANAPSTASAKGSVRRLSTKRSEGISAEFDIMYNEGISSTGTLLDLALEQGIVEKRGSWLSYKGSQFAQGRDAAKELLKSDQALYGEIEEAVKAKLDEAKEK